MNSTKRVLLSTMRAECACAAEHLLTFPYTGRCRLRAGGLGMRDQLIGTVAGEFGVSPKTLRYYETLGLLPRSSRNKSGYRIYGSGTGFRIRFIRKAKDLGLTLKEIQTILQIYNSGKPPCRSFQRLLQTHLYRIDGQIEHLRSLRGDLRNLLARWSDRSETGENAVCPRLEHFASTTRRSTNTHKGG